FHERAFPGELLDRVAAIEWHARTAVDVVDAALGRGGRGEARIVGEDVEVLVQTRDVERRRSDGAGPHRQLAAAPAGAVAELERCFRLPVHVHGRHSMWRSPSTAGAPHHEAGLHGPKRRIKARRAARRQGPGGTLAGNGVARLLRYCTTLTRSPGLGSPLG